MTTSDSREDSRRASQRSLISEFSSLCALAISCIALALGVYQTRLMSAQTELMRSQARGSVWPYLSIGYTLRDDGDKRGYVWEINNDGVGPARIESVTMSVDGTPVRKWSEVFQRVFGDQSVTATYTQIFGKVLPPSTNRETTIEAVHLVDAEQARVFHAADSRLQMTICYCSVYDDCWIAERGSPTVKPVPRCDANGAVQFEQKM